MNDHLLGKELLIWLIVRVFRKHLSSVVYVLLSLLGLRMGRGICLY